MLERIRTFTNRELFLFGSAFFGGVILFCFLAGFVNFISDQIPVDYTVHPKTTKEMAATSVRVVNLEQSTGGTGVIFKSTPDISYILTNYHVCKVVEQGGYVVQETVPYMIYKYKPYPYHDLCMVSVRGNLKVNTVVAGADAPKYSKAYISGHPFLLPHRVASGDFSNNMYIPIEMQVCDCDGVWIEKKTCRKYCRLTGNAPIIRVYDSQFVSTIISPGNSGSAVFDENGDINGLLFAGTIGAGGLGYAFIVPRFYIQDFVTFHEEIEWRTPSTVNGLDEILNILDEFEAQRANMIHHLLWSEEWK